MSDDLLDLALQILQGPSRAKLTTGDLKLLRMAADGKIKTPEQHRIFREAFADPINTPEPPEPAREYPEPAEPLIEPHEERRPSRIPRPDCRAPYIIRAADIATKTAGKAPEAEILERTVFALSLIYPENMKLLCDAAEYILEHQNAREINDVDHLKRLEKNLIEVEHAVMTLKGHTYERVRDLGDKMADIFDDGPEEASADDEASPKMMAEKAAYDRNYRPKPLSWQLVQGGPEGRREVGPGGR